MKILQVTLGFYPATAWGGPVKIVYQNGRELVRRGHRVTVYCTNLLDKWSRVGSGTCERQVDGMRVVYFHTWHLPQWPGTLGPVWLPDLPGFLRREISGYDLVHLNGYRNLMNLPVTRAARRAGVPLVMQPHGAMPVIVNSFLVKRLYDRLLGSQELKELGAVIALQESERQQAVDLGVPVERIEIIPNGLDLGTRAESPEAGSFRRRFGIPSGKSLILFLGRINKKKGPDMLVEAFHRLDGVDAHLAIAGPDDGQLGPVRDLVARYGLEQRVTLTGLLQGREVMAAYKDSDLFVLPCRADTFPTTILEACLANTPMVITDRCESAHLVEGRVADVVPFDATAFASAMGRLLTDGERYQRYRENCRSVMRDTFSLEVTVDRLESVYERVVDRRFVSPRGPE
jgi:glycosyltransferase involved in cell wall biosynthesis